MTNNFYVNYVPYFLTLILPLGLKYYNERFNHDINHIFVFVWFLLFSAFRGNGNGDYFAYKNGVNFITNLHDVLKPKNYPFEFGLRIIHYLNNITGLDAQITIIIMSIISLSTVYYIINKYSKDKFISWFLYFPFLLYFDMHHSRTAISINFTFLFFLTLVVEKELHKSIKFFILSYIFHKTSLIPLTIIVFYYLIDHYSHLKPINYHDSHLKVASYVFIITRIINLKNISILLSKTNNNNYYIRKFISYVNNDRWSYKFNLFDPRLMILILILLVSLYIYKTSSKYKYELKYYNAYLLFSILCVFIFQESTFLVMRFHNYFNIVIILLLPILMKIKNNYNLRFILIGILGYYMFYSIILISKEVPYYVWFLV